MLASIATGSLPDENLTTNKHEWEDTDKTNKAGPSAEIRGVTPVRETQLNANANVS
jgi:hypothetical protein